MYSVERGSLVLDKIVDSLTFCCFVGIADATAAETEIVTEIATGIVEETIVAVEMIVVVETIVGIATDQEGLSTT
jgi:hypothetical protein